jgi:hypothetical protein
LEEHQAKVYLPDSTIETEKVAACEATKEPVWLSNLLLDLDVVSSLNKLEGTMGPWNY